MYPDIHIERNKKPSQFYAIPLLGFLVKLILIIPVEIELFLLKSIQWTISIVNAFAIFFTGSYWKLAYSYNLGIMQLETNVSFFLWGLTDTYPGFALNTTNYKLALPFNKKPSRFLATPLLGLLCRFILLIPYLVYKQVVSLAATIAIFVSWIVVLTKKRYPETTYQIAVDSIRISQSVTAYMLGMSDSYPSWKIDLHHKGIKILLIVLAILFMLCSFGRRWDNNHTKPTNLRYMNTVLKTSPAVVY